MQKPTPDDLRARSDLLVELFPQTDPPTEPDPMQDRLDEAIALTQSLTGRDLGTDSGLEPVPTWLEPLAYRAVGLLTEQMELRSVPAARKASIKASNLRSFSAGPYSESYFGPGEAASAKVLSPDPETHAVLWALATDDKKDEWLQLWTGQVRPASQIVSFDWSLSRGRIPGGGYGPGVEGYPPVEWG